ncbi:MAG: class I SAM-dependent methyltransferase [Chloroflexota bacterium]|nr:class I SAM-dependent methyltransferase [Chloroflexota bacterium]
MTDERKRIVAAGYDAIGSDYLEWSARSTDPARERMLAEFVTRLPAGSRVLDLGCGAGLPVTRALAQRFTVTGVDVSAGQVAAARGNVPQATFIEGDLAEVDFPAESFDGVAAFYAISHVPREEHGQVFGRICRWLRPGGLFVASLGAHDSPDWTGEWLGRPMFFSSLDADENRRLLVDAGFELLIDEVLETLEPEGAADFLWVLARVGTP